MSGYKLTLRVRGRTTSDTFDDLRAALVALERIADDQARRAHAEPEGGGIMRRIEPGQQVVARLELSGPGRLRAGVDVRGDGSAEAYSGKLRRQVVEQLPGESAYDALGREVGVG